MMAKYLLYLIILILSFSLVSAIEISTNQVDYNSGDIVSIDVSGCSGNSILKIINPNLDAVDIKSGQDSWSTTYNTLSDSASGKYTISVSCTKGSESTNFCLDDDGCFQTSAPANNNGGGSNYCKSKWSCSQWSYCDANLNRTRQCVDLKNCESPREEKTSCDKCLESWTCSLWSECFNNDNSRDCYDEHKCGTTQLKPHLQKSCNEPFASGPEPAQIISQQPDPPTGLAQYVEEEFVPPPRVQKSSFWQDNKFLIVVGSFGLIVLVLIIIFVVHLFKSKHVAYNLSELKDWVKKERAMGTSNEDIRQILKQHTGWQDKEVDEAFSELNQEPVPMQKPANSMPKQSTSSNLSVKKP